MILLFIHEAKVRERIFQELQGLGYAVACARDGEDMLMYVSQMSPSVILLDLYLKNPSGLEILRRLRTEGYQGRVILLSGMSLRTEMPEAFSLGVDYVVSGPLALGELDCAINSVLGTIAVS